jgi:hypothetical protein
MRLGILGPANGDFTALARGAQHLVDTARVEKVLYLGNDDALDRVVENWGRELVGENPDEVAVFGRAASRCARATPEVIDAFVESERARLRLKVFVSLPRAPQRTIEILDGRLVVLVHDKASLDEDDIAAAALIVFGRSSQPLIKKVGPRTFLSPGLLGCETGGRAVLDDAGGGIRFEILAADGRATSQDAIGAPVTGAKMRVQGGGAG